MTDAPFPATLNLEVDRTATATIAKAQLRLGIAAIGGALVLRNVLPAALVNDQTIDLISGVVLLAAASAWAWLRAQLTHSRLANLAANPDVPADVVRFKDPAA